MNKESFLSESKLTEFESRAAVDSNLSKSNGRDQVVGCDLDLDLEPRTQPAVLCWSTFSWYFFLSDKKSDYIVNGYYAFGWVSN